MSDTLLHWLLGLSGTMIVMLLAGNLYFVRRLVDDIKSASDTAKAANAGVVSLSNLTREIKTDIKDLRRIEVDVAVLKAFYGLPSNKAHGGKDQETPDNDD